MIEELYETYYEELIRWCLAMTQSRAAAEDLVQDTFLKAMKHCYILEELGEKQRRSWLYQTAKNLYIDRLRRAAFELAVETLPEQEEEDAAYSAYSNEELLSKLPKEERVLFVMRYLEGYNSKELGELFSLPPGTVRSRLSSARKRLKEELEV
ncbi:MAG: RNA polymerase sigma factor [bacterium]|nr:RNA polymerase sigma factor [bacterium]